jgi:hypothetical protein
LFKGLKLDQRPLTVVLLLLAAVVILSWVTQALIWLVGLDYSVFSQRGRWIMVVLALDGVSLMMAFDRRPMSSFGIVFGKDWKCVLLAGLGTGLATLAAYYAAALALGTAAVGSDVQAARLLDAVAQSLCGPVVSATTHVIFFGYLLSIIRDRHSRIVSVVVMATLFAFMRYPDNPLVMLTAEQLPMFVGTFLAMALLALIRLLSGSILFGSGLLAGWFFVERMVAKSGLIYRATQGHDVLARCMFSSSFDAKEGPVMWGLLGVAIAVCSALLHRRGDARTTVPAAKFTPTSFKRLYPLMQTNMFAPLDLWLAQLWRAKFRIGLLYLPRLAFALVLSAATSVLTLPERIFLPLFLRRRSVKDPIFILGIHRSGTTHLQNMLALDDSLTTPRMYQVMNPVGFLFAGWPMVPVMACMPPRRPMDNMTVHVFAPAEEEFAMANTSYLSPYWSQAFPQQCDFYDRFIFPEEMTPLQRRRWTRLYTRFLKKLTLFSNKRPLLKSPYNTARVALLREVFPHAKFIHIHRHPYDVYRSNVRMAEQSFILTHLQEPNPKDNLVTRFPVNYRKIEETYYRDTSGLPKEQVAEVAFDDLERDPLGQIERIYRQLNLEFTDRFRQRLERYVESVRGYRKNKNEPLEASVVERLNAELQPLFELGGYDTVGAS